MRCKSSPELAAQRLVSQEPVWRTMEEVLHYEIYTGSFRRPTEREMLTTTAQEAIWLKDTKETMSTHSRRRSKRLSAALTSPTSQRRCAMDHRRSIRCGSTSRATP